MTKEQLVDIVYRIVIGSEKERLDNHNLLIQHIHKTNSNVIAATTKEIILYGILCDKTTKYRDSIMIHLPVISQIVISEWIEPVIKN
jgi:hypothetical protein